VLAGLVVVGVVLRLLWSARNGASFDESFTAMIGHHGFNGLLDMLRSSDSHPPLDYLLRAPLARAGAGDLAMRGPSLLFSIGALALFAWWMRTRGIAGVVAVALMAVSPFQIMYGGEARMYALLELLGVASAVVASRWLAQPRDWHAPVVGVLVGIAVLDHVSGWLLACGLLAVAGLRRDRSAWRWRVAIGAGLAVWTVLWGTSFLAQAATTHASWIAPTSWHGVAEAVARQVTNQSGVTVVVFALVAAGVVAVVGSDRVTARLVVCLGILPLAVGALLGLFVPFFIDRTLTVSAWVPCLAIGLAVEWAWTRSSVAGVAAAALVGVLVLPATGVFLRQHWEYDASVDHLLAVARGGDVVATVPDWYGPLVDWRVGVRAHGGADRVSLDAVPHAHAIRLGGGPATHRAWILSFTGDHRRFPGLERCAPPWTDGVTDVSCVVVGE
jgi:hypothetical protein